MSRDAELELAAVREMLAAAQDRIRQLEAALAERQKLLEEAQQDARDARLEAYRDGLTGLLNLRGIKLVVDYYCNPENLSPQGKKSAQFLINHIKDKCHDAQSSAVCCAEHRHGQNEGKGLLFVFDLNNLKEINDTYGHDAGDAYLLAFCKILKKFFRCSDFIAHARTGGDEFVAYLHETNAEQFRSRLHELYEEMKCIKFSYTDKKTGKVIHLKGSCAIGHTEIHLNSDDNYEKGYKRADVSMYANKRQMKSESQTHNISNQAGRERRAAMREKNLKNEYEKFVALKCSGEDGGLCDSFGSQVEPHKKSRYGYWCELHRSKVGDGRSPNPQPL